MLILAFIITAFVSFYCGLAFAAMCAMAGNADRDEEIEQLRRALWNGHTS